MKPAPPMPHCTASKISECREHHRECRHCPPMPPEGLEGWLRDIGYSSLDAGSRPRRRYSAHELGQLFLARVRRHEQGAHAGCWEWRGSYERGLPRFYCGHVRAIAYRWAYSHFRNVAISRRQVVVLSCHWPRCVNPEHAQALSARDFKRMTPSSRRTHAPV